MSRTQLIDRLLINTGLYVRGGLQPVPEDGAPPGLEELLLIGHHGRDLWRIFAKQRRPEPHPLDSWTRLVIEPVADRLGAVALYPSDGPPWLPFQRWAMKAEGLRPSPIGPLIHPDYGPWHGWRAALGFAKPADFPKPGPVRDVCAACRDKSCLKACPAQVFERGGYDVPRCVGHMKEPGNGCLSGGCLARRACPVGAAHAYDLEQGGFHASAFLSSMDRGG